MKQDIAIVCYAIAQKALEKMEMLNEDGSPKRAKESFDKDLVFVYDHLSRATIGVSQEDMRKKMRFFNEKAEKLHDDYKLNMSLFGFFMMDIYFNECGSKFDQGLLLPKVRRLISSARASIKEHNENPDDIIMDSSIAASNMYRLYTGKPELTKEMREKRRAMWRNAAKNRKKECA